MPVLYLCLFIKLSPSRHEWHKAVLSNVVRRIIVDCKRSISKTMKRACTRRSIGVGWVYESWKSRNRVVVDERKVIFRSSHPTRWLLRMSRLLHRRPPAPLEKKMLFFVRTVRSNVNSRECLCTVRINFIDVRTILRIYISTARCLLHSLWMVSAGILPDSGGRPSSAQTSFDHVDITCSARRLEWIIQHYLCCLLHVRVEATTAFLRLR